MVPFRNTSLARRSARALILLIALAIAALMVLFNPAKAQSAQAMVKNQPFPYAQGVAMDTVLYKSIKAKLDAANALRASSEQTIAALQAEITGLEMQQKSLSELSDYDAKKADSLSRVAADRKDKLDAAIESLDKAQSALAAILKPLPRRIRKTLQTATPDQLARAVVEYIETLQARKWKWAGASALFGVLASSLGIALLR